VLDCRSRELQETQWRLLEREEESAKVQSENKSLVSVVERMQSVFAKLRKKLQSANDVLKMKNKALESDKAVLNGR
jgi:DNA anti-recombination protein RmuC